MKKILSLIVVFLLLCGFRAPNGEIITEGDPVDKLIFNLGQPEVRTPLNTVWDGYANRVISEVWAYKIKGITYRFKIQNGVIDAIEWRR